MRPRMLTGWFIVFQVVCALLILNVPQVQAGGVVTNCSTSDDGVLPKDTLGELWPEGGYITFACSGSFGPIKYPSVDTTVDGAGYSVSLLLYPGETIDETTLTLKNMQITISGSLYKPSITIENSTVTRPEFSPSEIVANHLTITDSTLEAVPVTGNLSLTITNTTLSDPSGMWFFPYTLNPPSSIVTNYGTGLLDHATIIGLGVQNSSMEAVRNFGTLTISNSEIRDLWIGISSNGPSVSISYSVLANNYIHFNSGVHGFPTERANTVNFESTTFQNTWRKGGQILCSTDNFSLINSLVTGGDVSYVRNGYTFYEDPILDVQATHVLVQNSTVTNNKAGAGILGDPFADEVEITNSRFAYNLGGGPAITGARNVTVSQVTIAHNGTAEGEVRFPHALTIGQASLIYTALIENSLIHDNFGGGIHFSGAGSAEVRNTTLSQNQAGYGGGAIDASYGTQVKLVHTTHLQNSGFHGGIATRENASVSVFGSILANTGLNCSGSVRNDGFNLATDASCNGFVVTTTPQLDLLPLADNGGPTETIALGPNSRAIDVIPYSGCRTEIDQRGFQRPVWYGCDIGAFESDYGVAPPNISPILNYYTTASPVLTWNRIATAVDYEIQVDNTPDFKSLVYSSFLPANSLYATIPSLRNGIYYWRIRARQPNNVWGAWSSVDRFIVNVTAP